MDSFRALAVGVPFAISTQRSSRELIYEFSKRTAPSPQAFFDALIEPPESKETWFTGSVKGSRLRLYEPLGSRRAARRWIAPTFSGVISDTELGTKVVGRIRMRRFWMVFYGAIFLGVLVLARESGFIYFGCAFDALYGLTLLIGFAQIPDGINDLEDRIQRVVHPRGAPN